MNDKIKDCIDNFINSLNDDDKTIRKIPSCDSRSDELYNWAVTNGYLDACRTMKGIGKGENSKYRNQAKEEIAKLLKEYFENGCIRIENKKEYDFECIHKLLCKAWAADGRDVSIFNYGKAQKIVNMAFKYIYCALKQNDDLEMYIGRFLKCHMILDSYTLDWYNENAENYVSTEWSKLCKEEDYLGIQTTIRGILDNICIENHPLYRTTPFEAEFLVWNASIIYRVSKEYKKMKERYKKYKYFNFDKALDFEKIDDYINMFSD